MLIYCITNKNRTQHLERTLIRNFRDNNNSRFVLLDYNSQDHLVSYLKLNHQEDIDSGKLVVYSMLPCEDGSIYPFKMAHAKNMAHRLGILEGGDILVNLDADNYTGKDFDLYVSSLMQSDTYLWAKMIPGQLSRGISGRIVVTAQQFLNVGGYNEKYETWSPDDKDFNARLKRLHYVGREIDEKYLNAVPHNDKMRFKEYKHARTNMPEEYFDISDNDDTIVNYGKFGKGTVYKNFDFSNSIVLEDVPTRIFGVGMHKTATTSLHTALQILGYDSAHWKSAHWAKAIWSEMNILGKSITLEKSYALCDLPITILYDKLDIAYPGSKFILTIRNENQWIRSVQKHWDSTVNQFKKNWNKDPFSNFIHKELYGQTNFDVNVFLERYRRHNAEVKKYFAYRSDDFLILNINDGWDKLCQYLGKPVPTIPYPRVGVANAY